MGRGPYNLRLIRPLRKYALLEVEKVLSKQKKVIAYREYTKALDSLIAQAISCIDRKQVSGALEGVRYIADLKGAKLFIDQAIEYIPRQEKQLIVLSDLHGDLDSLKAILKQENILERLFQNTVHILFLGDYIDASKYDIELLPFLLELYCRFPEQITLIRGNHEFRYENEYEEKYSPDTNGVRLKDSLSVIDTQLWERLNALFEKLPVVCLTGNGIVGVHAGPPAYSLLDHASTSLLKNFGIEGLAHGHGIWRANAGQRNEVVKLDAKSMLAFSFVSRNQLDADEQFISEPWSPYVQAFPGRLSFEQFMSDIGAEIMLRGHDRLAPPDLLLFDRRFGTIISTDSRSPHHGYNPAEGIIGRYGLMSLWESYTGIDSEKHFCTIVFPK